MRPGGASGTVGPMAALDLFWLPLGAGGSVVRRNGQAYEWLVARREHRPVRALYHAALIVALDDGPRHVIEVGPIPDAHAQRRGVVAVGPVGARWAGRLRIFRYEVRCWPDGVIADLAQAVESPRHISDDPARARMVLELVRQVPTPVWGRDELHTGDMWNSNSVVSWLLARAGADTSAIAPPAGGRAPGWQAGLVAARRIDGRQTGPRTLRTPRAMS
jgi:hypothetical protein